jgi:Delta7-sterol 5-desaturase
MRTINLIVLLALCMLASYTSAQVPVETLFGEWATQGYSARVRIAPCADNSALACGHIVWLWDATDAHGVPLRDANNPNTELRERSLIGLPLLTQFRRDTQASSDRWSGGSIYDPESGRTYRASLTQRTQDALEVEGCVLFVCRKQLWRRATSLCPK